MINNGKKFPFFLLVLILPPYFSYAGWVKTFGGPNADYGDWVEQTSDKGFIVSGLLEVSPHPDRIHKVYLVKTDSLGDTLWTRTYLGEIQPSISTNGWCVQPTLDKGYIIAGNDGLFGGCLVKTDSAGNLTWTRTYDSTVRAYGVRETEGGYVFTGDMGVVCNDTLAYALFLMKVDHDGDSLWRKVYGGMTGNAWDVGFSLQRTRDGGFIVTGAGPEGGLWILRTNSLGDTLWSSLYKLGDDTMAFRGNCIEPTSDNGWIITGGYDYDVNTQGALLLMKIDSLGDTLWTRVYDYSNAVDVGRSVKQTPDGGYIVTGDKDHSMVTDRGYLWLLRTDSLGDTLWTRSYGGIANGKKDRGSCVQLCPDGGYIITGFSDSYSTDGSRDVMLMKTDSLGRVEGIEEEAQTSPVTWAPVNAIGHEIALRYSGFPQGFKAHIYDALGCKVGVVTSNASSDTVLWGREENPGVYFVRVLTENGPQTLKVVLVR